MPENSENELKENNEQIKNTWLVSVITLLSRVLGYARLIILVQIFSPVRWASDAFIFAFRIPNLLRALLGEGALSAAFIPQFIHINEKNGKKSASEFASQILTWLAIITATLCVITTAICLIIKTITPEKEINLTINLIIIMLPFAAFVCIAAILAGILQAHKKFNMPAILPIILNMAFLTAFAYIYWIQNNGNIEKLHPEKATYTLAIAVLIAGITQIIILIPEIKKIGVNIKINLNYKNENIKNTLKALGPTALGLGIVQVNTFIDSLIAGALSINSPGAITYLEIGNRFMQLPLGVFGVAIATIAFTEFSIYAANNDNDKLLEKLNNALRMAVFLILPCSAIFLAMADPIIRMAFQRTDLDFGHVAVYRSALVLSLYAGGLIFYTAQQIIIRAFYARKEYIYPVKIAVIMVILNLILNLTLIYAPDLYRILNPGFYKEWFLTPNDFPGKNILNEAGLALATLITAIISVIILAKKIYRDLRKGAKDKANVKKQNKKLIVAIIKITAAAIITAILARLYRNSIPYEPEFKMLVMRAIVPIILTSITYYVVCMMMEIKERKEFLGKYIEKYIKKRNKENI